MPAGEGPATCIWVPDFGVACTATAPRFSLLYMFYVGSTRSSIFWFRALPLHDVAVVGGVAAFSLILVSTAAGSSRGDGCGHEPFPVWGSTRSTLLHLHDEYLRPFLLLFVNVLLLFLLFLFSFLFFFLLLLLLLLLLVDTLPKTSPNPAP